MSADRGVTEVAEPSPMLLPTAELPRTQIIERTRHRYEDIHRLLEKRWTLSAIARRLNHDPKTVRRFRGTGPDELPASAHERRPAFWSRARHTSTAADRPGHPRPPRPATAPPTPPPQPW
ncbi:hypothetical protein ACFXDH_51060 [Streptomyces sp. NPDC059467]|uniref:hypothetical protein n=1 Tax=Streptomyces sp. NPDC059467 TaxID=3346844 RepID=UPI00368B350C